MTNNTPRMSHAQRLSLIASLNGQYNRRFSFKEAQTYVETYIWYVDNGYAQDVAAQYAYDHYCYDRGVRNSKLVYGRDV